MWVSHLKLLSVSEILNLPILNVCILKIEYFSFSALICWDHLRCCCCLVASVMSDSVQPYGLQPARHLCPWDSLGGSTGVGCYALLQETSQPRDRTQISSIAGRFFTTEPPGKSRSTSSHYKFVSLNTIYR